MSIKRISTTSQEDHFRRQAESTLLSPSLPEEMGRIWQGLASSYFQITGALRVPNKAVKLGYSAYSAPERKTNVLLGIGTVCGAGLALSLWTSGQAKVVECPSELDRSVSSSNTLQIEPTPVSNTFQLEPSGPALSFRTKQFAGAPSDTAAFINRTLSLEQVNIDFAAYGSPHTCGETMTNRMLCQLETMLFG